MLLVELNRRSWCLNFIYFFLDLCSSATEQCFWDCCVQISVNFLLSLNFSVLLLCQMHDQEALKKLVSELKNSVTEVQVKFTDNFLKRALGKPFFIVALIILGQTLNQSFCDTSLIAWSRLTIFDSSLRGTVRKL